MKNLRLLLHIGPATAKSYSILMMRFQRLIITSILALVMLFATPWLANAQGGVTVTYSEFSGQCSSSVIVFHATAQSNGNASFNGTNSITGDYVGTIGTGSFPTVFYAYFPAQVQPYTVSWTIAIVGGGTTVVQATCAANGSISVTSEQL